MVLFIRISAGLILTTLIVCAFIVVVTSRSSVFFTIRSYVVLTGSMEPAIPTGSMVFVRPSSLYKPPDIITYQSGTTIITHRIIDRILKGTRIIYVTKGDANKNLDSRPVFQDRIIGKVFFHIPAIGMIVRILQTPWGFTFGIILPGLISIGMEVHTICIGKIKKTV